MRAAIEKGRQCDEFQALRCSSFAPVGAASENFVLSELAKLEARLIKDAVGDFQKSVNKSLESADVYIFEKGLRALKGSISDCFTFCGLKAFSGEGGRRLSESIRTNYLLFLDEWERYVRKTYECVHSPYVEEMAYVYKKANVKKFIQEHMVYE